MSSPLEPAAGDDPWERIVDRSRLSVLEATGLVDGPNLEGLDRLTRLATQILGTPVALASLVTDRDQFFASAVGLPEPMATSRRTPLSHSFCKHVVATRAPLVVTDARLDPRVRDNPAIPELGVIAYAGFPLRAPDDQVLGAFCAIDVQPRQWTDEQLTILDTLTDAASSEIALLLANQELRRSGAHLQEVLSSAPDAFVSIDGEGRVTEWNASAHELFGWSRDEAVGRDLAELVIPPRYRSSHRRGLDRVRQGAPVTRRLEVTAADRSGTEFPIQITLQVAQTRTGPLIHAFLSGVSARRDREVALARERTFLAAVLDSVDVGVVAAGTDGRIALFNKAMRRIWGAHAEPLSAADWWERIGMFQADGVTPLSIQDAPLARALSGEPVRDAEVVMRTGDGTTRRFTANAQPVVAVDGRGLGAVVALHDITDRRHNEVLQQNLDQARADLHRVIENVNDFMWTVEVLPDGRVAPVFASSDGSGVFGTALTADPGQDLNTWMADLVHPADQGLFQAFHREILAGRNAEVECRVTGRDGVERWVWTRAAPRYIDGRLLADGISSNVSRRKHGEFALAEERRRLRQAQAIAQIGSWEWDVGRQRMNWSQSLFELYGVDPAEYTAEEARDLCLHPADAARVSAVVAQCAQDRQPFQLRLRVTRQTDGEERVFEARGEVLPGAAGQALRLGGTAMDITDQVRAERAIASRESMLSAILANSQSLIYVKDLEGRYLMVNEPLLRARSLTEAELIGTDDYDLDPELAPLWRANDARAREGQYAVEEWFDGPEGRYFYDTVKFPLQDGDGNTYAICGISLDVTERRRAEQAMTQARDAALASNAAKSSFLATMSHEIRTPMNAVIGMTDLLLDTDLDSRQLEYVETVRTSGDALLAIINDILDFSRIEAGEMELEDRPFDLRHCVEDSLSLTAGAAAGIDLVAHVGTDCPQFVRGDVNRLRQVLVNLVGNAVKFTKAGDVLVSVTAIPAPGDRVGLRFAVRDTGIGIPPERMDRLFKSFSQVDASTTRVYGGSGLGLAISKAIVQAMGGDITVVSEVGSGSTFSFEIGFERCDDADAPPAPPGTGSVPDLSGCRVLVVDDNDTNRRILRLQLEAWGMVCTDLAVPPAALVAIQNGAVYDLAILDMNMPGTDGVQLATLIRSLPAGRDLPLILLTSLNTSPQGATDELFAGFHTKPIRAGTLRSMLGQVLAPDPAAEHPHRRARRTTVAGSPLRVLLAEDNLVNQKVARGMLTNLGHSVDIVGDGQQALDAVRDKDYDVVLMDVHMPTMDGLDAARQIRAQIPEQRRPRIVAMTASSLPEDRQACEQAGMSGYLLKPVRSVALAETLRRIPVLVGSAPAAAGSVPAPPGTAAVDLDVLHQLMVDMGADSPAAVAELTGAYLEQGGRWVGELADAVTRQDLDRIRVITHTLGSSSALLGIAGLAGLLDTLGDLARSDTPGGAGSSGGEPTRLALIAEAAIAEYHRAAAELATGSESGLDRARTAAAGSGRPGPAGDEQSGPAGDDQPGRPGEEQR